MAEWAGKPNSVPNRASTHKQVCACHPSGQRSFIWARRYRRARAPYPGLIASRAGSRPLFGLAGDGVCPAATVTGRAVRSYRTFSPLPAEE